MYFSVVALLISPPKVKTKRDCAVSPVKFKFCRKKSAAMFLCAQRRRNGFKSQGAYPFLRAGKFFKSAPPLLFVPPPPVGWAQLGTKGAQTGTASCEFSYFTAFILSPIVMGLHRPDNFLVSLQYSGS